MDANAQLIKLINTAEFADIKQGIRLHVTSKLPRPITLNEMMLLSKSDDDMDHYVLAELLKMYPTSYGNEEETRSFISLIISNALFKTLDSSHMIWQGLRTNNPVNNSHIETLFTLPAKLCF